MDSESLDESQEIRNFIDPMAMDRPHPPRGSAWLAWIIIFITIGLIVTPGVFDEPASPSDPSIIALEIQAKYLVGAASMNVLGDQMNEEQIQAIFGKGSLRQRLMGAVLLGELVNADKSTANLHKIEADLNENTLNTTANDRDLVGILERIQISTAQKQDLETAFPEEWQTVQKQLPDRLGWVGRLALRPPGSLDLEGRARLLAQARRTLIVIFSVFGMAVIAIACGAALQLLWWVFALTGRLHMGISPLRGYGAIYAETFAVWLALFLAVSYLLKNLPLPKLGLIWVLIPQIGGLAALAWPVVRGVRWKDVRSDIGLSFGTNAWKNPLVGVGTYLAALPVVGMAMIVTLLMMTVASQFAGPDEVAAAPIHPIVEPILRGSWSLRWQLVFEAVFAAIPEEIMFRGFLYRHLREAGKSFGYVGRVAFAALISSFVFAVIHPQGLFGIPILMSLAIVLAVVREWRDSLVPSIIAHALVNAGTSSILLLMAD